MSPSGYPCMNRIVRSIGFVYVLYVGYYLLILEFESWITGVCSLYVVCVILHTM